MTATATEVSCPKCGGRMWDNRETKRSPKAPDYKCRDTNCDGVVWPPRNGKAPTHQQAPAPAPARQEFSAGPDLPGEREDMAKVMLTLYRDCFSEALRMVKKLNADSGVALEFTSDNVCSITSTLFIEANKKGLVRLAA